VNKETSREEKAVAWKEKANKKAGLSEYYGCNAEDTCPYDKV
jgi:hypothetical protein